MKRTKSEAEETRRRLLGAGLEVFLQKGFDRASLEEIAQRVEMTRGAVYWHFKDKQELLDELIKYYYEPVEYKINRLLADEEISPLQKITSFVRTILYLLAEDESYRTLQRLLLRCNGAVPGYENHYSLWQHRYQQELEKLFWKAQTDRAVMSHVSPRYLATYALSIINGLVVHMLDIQDSAIDRHRLADQTVFLFMRSLQ